MATPRSDIQKKGYLYKLPVSGNMIKVWAKRWAVLKCTSPDGVVRLEYYDKEENEIKGENKRVIILRGCTGCCETSEYKRAKPYAFQFSTSLGHHVFATETQNELDEWIDSINQYIQEDRRKQRKKNKSKMMEETRTMTSDRSGSSVTSGGGGERSRDSNVPHPSTLMGVYQVIIEENDYSQRLNLVGIHSLCVTPRGLRLVSRNDESTVGAWHFRHIRSYAKSTNKQVILDIGNSRRMGEGGKLLLTTGSSKEMFSMIHRNIKFLKSTRDREKQETKTQQHTHGSVQGTEGTATLPSTSSTQVTDSELQSKKRLRPRSRVYELQNSRSEGTTTSHRFPSFIEQDDDLIHLEGFNAEGLEDVDEDLQKFLDSLDPIMQHPNTSSRFDSTPVLNSVDSLSSEVYGTTNTTRKSSNQESIDHPPPLPPPRISTTSNPFANVDPFNTPPHGSFYNSNEDIFETFNSSPQKTSTPAGNTHPSTSTNPFHSSDVSAKNGRPMNPFLAAQLEEEILQLEISPNDPPPPPLPPPRKTNEEYIYAIPNKPPKPKNRMSTQEFDQVWDDIVSDITWS